jgi:preprotein translocase subunit SecE
MKSNKIYKLYSEIKHEAKKIIWPNRQELISTFFVVICVIIISSLCFLFFDYIMHSLITLLLNIGK